ncbi:hypothetical protein [Stappia stellulata]|jgi:ferric-dicitrate binding protein FerR (iron transport regulator)|nr:hypothetical protein [Stappia stellulata]
MATPPKKPRRPAHDENRHPVLHGLALFVCVAAFLGALFWKAMGW